MTAHRAVRLVVPTALITAAVFMLGGASASASIICGEACGGSVALTKSGPAYVAQGQEATYTFTVFNDGQAPLSGVVVSDDLCSPVTGPTDKSANDDDVVDPGETWTYTCTYAPAGSPGDVVTNTASVTASASVGDGQSGPVSDTYEHSTTIVGLLITKVVDNTTADRYDELTYTITIKHDGPDWFDFSGYLSDSNCSYPETDSQNTDGAYFWLAPGESVTYTCHAIFDPDGQSQTNTACADVDLSYNEQPALTVDSEGSSDVQACASATTTVATHHASGQVFEDLNADGVRQAGEPALPGIVQYADLNGNGVRDEGEPSGTSGADGRYSIVIALGKATIRQDVPGGMTCSFPAGCAYTVDLPENDPPQILESSVLARAVDPDGLDFGDWRPASVSGTVIADLNGNGVRDAGEGVIQSALVYADLNGNSILDVSDPSVATAADGSYVIGGLRPGGYVIRHVLDAGRTCTAPAGCNHAVTLVSNEAATGRDFLDAPPPGQAVLPSRVVAGTARMGGATGCAARPFSATIRGRQIRRVRFYVDGKLRRTLSKPNRAKIFALRVNPAELRNGTHWVTAKVTFTSASRTKAKTMRLYFKRCARQIVAPQFTG